MRTNKYRELKDIMQKEVNEFPLMAAFSNEQFEDGKRKLNVKEDNELCSIGYGVFIRKNDIKTWNDMDNRHDKLHQDMIAADKDGMGYIYDMFRYELGNHEYIVTYDTTYTLSVLGLSEDDVCNDERLKNGLQRAIADIMEEDEKCA